ncbi:SUMF1/EgtB/PvdO family nonheme iron enzyme [Thalassomonas viridans]|uniref:SUMF1/EgtB/PvdO family nonheme iron enzyme n=1 Tax=Thalassomonas viridans TaxID=137584 RepID=A0AAE9Z4Q3_9GAMM|nr:SUMF1/EgtB/PvdO family nonheme iron enzyme [Thalassomonas viridans]WDE06701.1 SUMF1/EgtB/PvdO family nonheme iron enzyme [Thalassomonas viridans]
MKVNKLFIALCLSANSYALYAGGPIEPVMVTIPGGSFEMGNSEQTSAQPLHKVNIREFSMGKYEVTVSEFRRFIAATGYQAAQECRHELDGWFRPGSKGNWEVNALNTSEFQPVVCITWQDADAYVKWLAKETGKPYRLPSEAEWEYAARAGTKTDYYFGDDTDGTLVCDYENTGDLSGENILQRESNTSYHNWTGEIANCADHSGYASIVGMYKANPFGLHDMVSNIREMLADCYTEDYSKATGDGSAYLGGSCERRAIRGSSWHWSHWPLVQRSSFPEDFAGGVDGFRLALDGKAPKLSKASSRFLAQLTFAQEQEQKRRDRQPEFPDAVTNLKIEQNNDSVVLTWDKSKQDDIESYRVYRNEIAGGMFKLLAANLTQTSYTDSNVSPYKYDYTVVAVRYHQQSLYSNSVSTRPGWVAVPGRVQAQWAADFSGSELTFTSDESGGYNFTGVGGISDEANLKYQIDVAKAGLYRLEYRVASPRDTKGFELYANDKKAGVNQVAETGGYHEWQTQQGVEVYLEKGKNTVTLKSLDNNWKLNWLSLKQG